MLQSRNSNKIMKNKETEQESFPRLPKEITIEIFEILSLKYVAKAISVCKHWDHLIHTSVNLTRPKVLLTSHNSVCKAPFVLFSIDTKSRIEKVNIPNLILSNSSKLSTAYLITRKTNLKFTGSCNGLVLVEAGYDHYIWNPLTNYTEVVIKPSIKIPSMFVLGLCHDSSVDKYKVVVATRNVLMRYFRAYVWVVSSEAASCKTVDFDYAFYSLSRGPVLKGYLHSVAVKMNNACSIIAFDPRADWFSEVPMPVPRGENGDFVLGLGVLNGCICMARRESPVIESSNIDILIMKNYGVASSWAISCSLKNLDSFGYIRALVPLCYNDDGKVLVHVNGQRLRRLNICECALEELGGITDPYQDNSIFYDESWVKFAG